MIALFAAARRPPRDFGVAGVRIRQDADQLYEPVEAVGSPPDEGVRAIAQAGPAEHRADEQAEANDDGGLENIKQPCVAR